MDISQVIANHCNVTVNNIPDTWTPIRCPLSGHNDSSPSAALNFESKMFHCFKCGSLHFTKLAKELELTYDETSDDNPLFWLDEFINNTNTIPVKQTTFKKQITEFTNFLIERKLKPDTVLEFGEYISNPSSDDYGFLIFSYGDNKYVKRRIIQRAGTERFINSVGSDKGLFCKNIEELKLYDSIIMCEGITDFLTLRQAGYRNVCATLGADVSKQQMYHLRNKIIYILFDKDYAGFTGAKKASQILKEFDSSTIILEIPDEFITTGKTDVNSAYVEYEDIFLEWLQKSIDKYKAYDESYIDTIFLKNYKDVKYVETGIRTLDKTLSGGFATGLHAIAGLPEAGKSTFITHLTKEFLLRNQKVLLLPYELPKEQMYSRLASTIDTNNWVDIEKDHKIIDEITINYLKEFSTKLRIERDWNVDEIKVASKHFDVIIIDYLQRMPSDEKDPRLAVKSNAYRLADITKQGKLVIMISSIPQAMYGKTGFNVFKESGDIEYIVQSGWILSKLKRDTMELDCIKNTRGAHNKIYLKTDYQHQTIEETTMPTLEEILS